VIYGRDLEAGTIYEMSTHTVTLYDLMFLVEVDSLSRRFRMRTLVGY
jgi:hypothetical protein